MDFSKLANLIFPDVKNKKYYEEKYPKRNLSEGSLVTRFAPSPTGFVHIGGLFGSIIDQKIAKQTNRNFYIKNRRYRSKKRNRKWYISNNTKFKRF